MGTIFTTDLLFARRTLTVLLVLITAKLMTRNCSGQDIVPGVFGITTIDVSQKTKVVGTAFLIDRRQGYVLTAAHVLRDLGLHGKTDSISLQLSAALPDGRNSQNLVLPMSARVIACSCDFVAGSPMPDRGSDWALLQIDKNDTNWFALDFFSPILINPDQADVDLRGKAVRVIGFPNGIFIERQGSLSSADADGSWLGSLTVQFGNSGGPCIATDSLPQLMGIVLEEGTLGPEGRVAQNTVRILPSHRFLDKLAELTPPSDLVKSVIDHLKQKDSADANDKARDLVRIYIALTQMTGLEHAQLSLGLKDPSIPAGSLASLVYSYLRYFRSSAASIDLMKARPELASLMSEQASQTVAAIKIPDRNVGKNELEWALAVQDFVTDAYKNHENIPMEKSRIAKAAVDYVYLYEELNKPKTVNTISLDKIALAQSLDIATPDLLPALAIAGKNLDTHKRLLLTADKVDWEIVFQGPGDVTTLNVEPSKDHLAYSLWRSALKSDLSVASARGFQFKTTTQFVNNFEAPKFTDKEISELILAAHDNDNLNINNK